VRPTPPDEPEWTVYQGTVRLLRDATLSAAVARALDQGVPNTSPEDVFQVVHKTSLQFFGWARSESFRLAIIDVFALAEPAVKSRGKWKNENLSLDRLVSDTTFVRQGEEQSARSELARLAEQLDRTDSDGGPSLREFRNKLYAHADLDWGSRRYRKQALWLPPMRVALEAARAVVKLVSFNRVKDERVETMMGQIDEMRESVNSSIDLLFQMAKDGLRHHCLWEDDSPIDLRLNNFLAAHPELAVLEVLPHTDGLQIRRKDSPEDKGSIVAAQRDRNRVDWSYRANPGRGHGFGFGTFNAEIKDPELTVEILPRLRDLARTGEVGG
jgi:hypothetical protein